MRDLTRIVLFAPAAAAAITAEKRLAAVWPLRFPRTLTELEHNPQRLVDLLTTPSRGLLAPLAVPAGATFVSLRRRGSLANEPDKDRTTAVMELLFRSGNVDYTARVVVKLQSGRGMPLYIQAIRAVLEHRFSREIEFYRQLAPIVPVRVARPLFADAVTFVNRVCLVVEYVESETPADWRGCSRPAMRAMLADAARLNAHFLGRLSDPRAAWIPARSGLDYAKFVEGFIAKTEPWYREVWAALQAYFAGRPVTLVHGDCRPGNMLFTGASEAPDVVMSDWEAVNIAPLMWDFTYGTIIGLRVDDRTAWLDGLLAEFLTSLAQGGVSAAQLDPGQCRLEVDLLAIVLAYVSLVVFENGLWSGQGNTAEDIQAWGARVREAAVGSDPEVVARALGVEPAHIRRLHDRLKEKLSATGQ